MENKSVNILMQDFKQSLVNLINQSGLPLGIIYYIYKDVYNSIENTYMSNVKLERENLQNIKEKENSTEQTQTE